MEWFMDVLHLVIDTASEDDGPIIQRIADRHARGPSLLSSDFALMQVAGILADYVDGVKAKGQRMGGLRRD